jgi:hypothetical protein
MMRRLERNKALLDLKEIFYFNINRKENTKR